MLDVQLSSPAITARLQKISAESILIVLQAVSLGRQGNKRKETYKCGVA